MAVFECSVSQATSSPLSPPTACRRGLRRLASRSLPTASEAYVAAADPSGGSPDTLRVFNPATGVEIDSVAVGAAVGALPTAIAVHPSGDLVFVSNKNGNSVSVYNRVTRAVVSTVPTGGSLPTGIAYSPDGLRVYVANSGHQQHHHPRRQQRGSGCPARHSASRSAPLAIAINASGTTAYVSQLTTPASVTEVGGMRTLTVNRGGTGIGSVRSTPVGIDCGTSCQAQFALGTSIALSATSQSGSNFAGWSGANCGSNVTLNDSMTCTATFNSNTPPPSQQQPPQRWVLHRHRGVRQRHGARGAGAARVPRPLADDQCAWTRVCRVLLPQFAARCRADPRARWCSRGGARCAFRRSCGRSSIRWPRISLAAFCLMLGIGSANEVDSPPAA